MFEAETELPAVTLLRSMDRGCREAYLSFLDLYHAQLDRFWKQGNVTISAEDGQAKFDLLDTLAPGTSASRLNVARKSYLWLTDTDIRPSDAPEVRTAPYPLSLDPQTYRVLVEIPPAPAPVEPAPEASE